MVFEAEQAALGRSNIGGDENGLAGLEDLSQRGDTDRLEILLNVEAACWGDRIMEDVVDAAQGEGMVEEVAEQFLNAAKGAVADEGEAKNELAKPGLGNGEPEQQPRGVDRRQGKSLVEGVVGMVELLVDELAADVLVLGEVGDGYASQGIEGKLLAGRPGQQGSAAGLGRLGGWNTQTWDSFWSWKIQPRPMESQVLLLLLRPACPAIVVTWL